MKGSFHFFTLFDNRWNPVGGKLHVLAEIEAVYGFDEADHAYLEEIVHALAAIGEALHDREHEPEVPGDQPLPRRRVAGARLLEQRAHLRRREPRQRRRVHPADLDLSLYQKTPLLHEKSGVSISRRGKFDTDAPWTPLTAGG